MTTQGHLKIAGIAVAIFTAWTARSLFDAWLHSPFDRWDGAAWIIWMVPVFASLWEGSSVRVAWPATALVFAFVGALLDLNLLKHLAFAVASAGLVVPRRGLWVWFPVALSWMPIVGWVLSKYDVGATTVGMTRVAFATIGTVCYFSTRR